jgi:hypothetical protein
MSGASCRSAGRPRRLVCQLKKSGGDRGDRRGGVLAAGILLFFAGQEKVRQTEVHRGRVSITKAAPQEQQASDR